MRCHIFVSPLALATAVFFSGAFFAAAPAWADGGVTIYEHRDYGGRSVVIRGDAPNLDYLPVSNDRASSLRVERGCVAELFPDERYRGRSIEVRGNLPDLSASPIGNDRLSSIRVYCGREGWEQGREHRPDRQGDRGRDDRYEDDRYRDDRYRGDRGRDQRYDPDYSDDWRGRRGVILYEHAGFRGRSELLEHDDDRLDDNVIGNDRVSSLRIAPGCQVTLFEHSRYRGRQVTLEYDQADLSRTLVGNDRLTSLRVRCSREDYRGRGERGGDFGWIEGIMVYSDTGYRGHSSQFTGDVRNLRRSPFGNDRASSLRLARGCVALLYEHEDFRGREIRVRGDIEDLGVTRLGRDRLSSIRLDCRDRR